MSWNVFSVKKVQISSKSSSSLLAKSCSLVVPEMEESYDIPKNLNSFSCLSPSRDYLYRKKLIQRKTQVKQNCIFNFLPNGSLHNSEATSYFNGLEISNVQESHELTTEYEMSTLFQKQLNIVLSPTSYTILELQEAIEYLHKIFDFCQHSVYKDPNKVSQFCHSIIEYDGLQALKYLEEKYENEKIQQLARNLLENVIPMIWQ